MIHHLGSRVALTLLVAVWAPIVSAQIFSGPTPPQGPKLGVSLRPGVQVDEVDEGSVAAAGGIKHGDYIVSCDGQTVTGLPALRAWLEGVSAGQEGVVVVLRGDDEVSCNLKFAQVGEDGVRLGVAVQEGLRVSGVAPGSPAATAGVLAGDLLMSFQGTTISDFDVLRGEIAKMANGGEAAVVVRRNGDEMTLKAPFAATAPGSGHAGGLMMTIPDEPGTVDIEEDAPAEGFSFSGLADWAKLLDIGELRADLTGVIELLKPIDSDIVRAAVERLTAAERKLQHLERMTSGLKGFTSGLRGAFDGFPPLPPVEEMPGIADRIQARVQELLEGGLDLDKLRAILAEEFPGVSINISDDSTPPAPPADPASGGGK